MKKCNSCQKLFEDEIKFCPYCGEELKYALIESVRQKKENKAFEEDKKPKSDKHTYVEDKSPQKKQNKTGINSHKDNDKEKCECEKFFGIFSVKGRCGRLNFLLMMIGLNVVNGFVDKMLDRTNNTNPMVSLVFMILLFAFPYIVFFGQRLHDLNKTAKWAVLWYSITFIAIFIPYAAAIQGLAVLCLVFIPGTEGTNKYGPDPTQDKFER